MVNLRVTVVVKILDGNVMGVFDALRNAENCNVPDARASAMVLSERTKEEAMPWRLAGSAAAGGTCLGCGGQLFGFPADCRLEDPDA
jgi:hypothetical protein